MESEKVKEIKDSIQRKINRAEKGKDDFVNCVSVDMLKMYLTLINDFESENERLLNEKWDKEDDLDNYHEENKQLKDRIAELEEGIAQSMLGCEFLPECTKEKEKEVAEKIWNIAKNIVQGGKYLYIDALKEIIKSCGVEIKE